MSDAEQAVGTFWVFNLDWPTPSGVEPAAPATFARLLPEAAPALAQAMGHTDVAQVLTRLTDDRRCYAIWCEGTLAAYGWVSYKEEDIGELNLHMQFERGEAYIWDCATLPAFRGRHFYTALLVNILRELRTQGLCRVWIGADAENTVSLRGIARAGFVWVSELCINQAGAMRLRGRPGVADFLVDTTRRILLNEPV
jgi:ribosomal protein S18 acetylase RimI-like enzyme